MRKFFVLMVLALFAISTSLLAQTWPPTNLSYTVEDQQNVNLSWDAPQNPNDIILHYDDGVNNDGIGTGGAADFDVAIKFDPDQISAYNGYQLTQVDFVPREAACEYSIRIWQGTDGANLLVDQHVDSPVIEDWNYIALATPVTIDASQELWIGYRCNTTAGYPAGCDAGPADAGYGDLIYFEGAWASMADAYGLNYNWNIQGHVSGSKSSEMLTPIATFNSNMITESVKRNNPFKLGNLASTDATHQTRDFIGYNVYRDGTLLADMVADTHYADMGLAEGTYEYYVTADYDEGESDPTNTVEVTIQVLPIVTVLEEDFENGDIPADWGMTTNSAAGWYVTQNGSSDYWDIPAHTFYAVSNDDAANDDGSMDYLFTPAFDMSTYNGGYITFQSFFTGAYSQTAHVEASTDGTNWTLVEDISSNDAWAEVTVDISAYTGAGFNQVWFAFHSNDNGAWASGWAVDDVQIMAMEGGPVEYGTIEGYVYDNDTMNGIAGATVTAGTNTATTDGTGMYSMMVVTGTYDVTANAAGYMPSTEMGVVVNADQTVTVDLYLMPEGNPDLNPPRDLAANVMGSDVHLSWIEPDNGGSGEGIEEGFEGGDTPADWEVIQTNTDASASTPGYWTVNDYSSTDYSPMGTYHAGLWWSYDHQDEWLVTPEFECASGTSMEFWTAVYEGSTNADHYYVKASTDGGATWTEIWDASTLTGNAWNYYQYSYVLDLSAFAGNNVKLAFNAVDGPTNDGLWYVWFVDDVTISDGAKNIHFNGNDLTYRSAGDRTIARNGNTSAITKIPETAQLSRDLTGYNVYRDGSMIDYTADLFYDDMGLMPGTYSYSVTAVYDEGESLPAGPVDAVIEDTSMGTLEGMVYDPTMNPLADATVVAGSYSTTTDGTGAYSMELPVGIYNPVASMEGYASDTAYNIEIIADTVTELDFTLGEINPELNPPRNLVADVVANDVELSWSAPSTGGGEEWSEGFEGGDTPADWEVIQTNTDASASTPGYWTVNDYSSTDYSPMGTYHAGLWWSYDHQDEWLVTPEFECGGDTSMEFWAAVYEGSTNADHYYVKVSTDGGATWTEIWDASTLTGNAWNYYQYSYVLDLSAFDGNNIKVAFNAVDGPTNDGLWYVWFVDDITIGAGAKTVHFSGKDLTYRSAGDRTIARNGNTNAISKIPETAQLSRDLLGYNVYKDGMLLANTSDLMYTDADLDAGTYNYEVTAVYDEGESIPVGPVEAVILGTGMIEGVVTDGITSNPVVDAVITAGEYETMTGADGSYSLDVVEGTYDVTCIAVGYAPQTTSDIAVGNGDVVTVDFEMFDQANPPHSIVAEVNDEDTAVTVTWSEPGQGGGEEQWIHYDDGVNNDGIGTGGAADFDVAIKFDPDQLEDVNYMYLTEVKFVPREAACDYSIRVWTGTDGANLVVDQPVDAPVIEDWNTIELDNSVQIDASEELWIGYRCNTSAGYPAGCDAGPAVAGYGDLIYFEGAWNSMADAYGLNYNWNIQGWLSNAAKGELASQPLPTIVRKNQGTLAYGNLPNVSSLSTLNETSNANRALEGYAVYRLLEGDENDEDAWTELIDGTSDLEYVDNGWNAVDSGIYLYGVKAIYTGGNYSDAAFSNPVYKNMTVEVNVEVTTNSGDDAQGAIVILTNQDGDPEHMYEMVAPAGGVAMFDAIWKGIYDLEVSLAGYTPYMEANIELLEDTDLEAELAELLIPPNGLEGQEVSMTDDVELMWNEPATFMGWTEDFEDGSIPEGWSMETNSSAGWYVTQNGSSSFWDIPSHTYYAVSNDDEANDDGSMDYLITPEQDFSTVSEMTLTFQSFFTAAYSQTAHLEISTDGSNWENIMDIAEADAWTQVTVDLSDYTGAGYNEVWIAFHSNDNGAWASGWAIDDVVMGDGGRDRELIGYNVYRDDDLLTDAPITATTYLDEDVPTGSHIWQVTAVYTTGESDPAEWEGNVDAPVNELPAVTELQGNYPNPFNPSTTVQFATRESGHVTLEIYNVKGQKVKTLVDDRMDPGYHVITWDGRNDDGQIVTSGIYFSNMKTGKYTATKKMILMK